MLKQYLLLLLGLIVAVQSHEICNFEKNMCSWSNLHSCHFVHEKNKPLAGEKGYLYISKNTCKRAGILFSIERSMHRFQLHYFINGTGNGLLAVSANYLFSGRKFLWTCNLNQGTQWQKADIFVVKEGFFSTLRHIYIEAFIRRGDITIAIGNISAFYSGHPMQSCPPAPRITNKPTIRTTITKKPTPKPTTVLKTTSSIITSPAKPKVDHSIRQTASQTNTPNTILSQVTTAAHVSRNPPLTTPEEVAVSSQKRSQPVTSKSPSTTPEKAVVSSQQRTQPIKITLDTSSISVPDGLTSDQNKHKVTTAKPAATTIKSTLPKPMTTSNPQQTTPVQDVTTRQTVSGGTNDKQQQQQQQSPKSKRKGLIIGVSLFAVVLATVVIVFAVLMHKRKIRIWNV